MKNPAREKFLPLLSPYVDGELTPEERQQVEQHLASNKESQAQVADFRAADGLIRHALELQADSMDWSSFSSEVMSKVSPGKLPWLERVRLFWSEMVSFQPKPLVAGLVGAAVAVAIAVPVSMKLATPDGYGASAMRVQTVSVGDNATVKPVVMETASGDAIIWVVDAAPDAGKKKKDGENAEETLMEVEGQEGPL